MKYRGFKAHHISKDIGSEMALKKLIVKRYTGTYTMCMPCGRSAAVATSQINITRPSLILGFAFSFSSFSSVFVDPRNTRIMA